MASHPEFNRVTDGYTVADTYSGAIEGRTFLITGVSLNGLGQSTTEALAAHKPALLILTGRTEGKVLAVINTLATTYPDVKCKYLHMDLSSLSSVRVAAREVMNWQDVPEIDVVICNAGVMWIAEHQMSVDQIEMQFATNHIGHFLFVNLILKKLTAASAHAPPGAVRIVNVSSGGAMFSPVRFSDPNFAKEQKDLPENERANTEVMKKFGMRTDGKYNPYIAYGQSKSANILWSLGLTARLYEKFGIKSYALHPGGILTDLWRHTDDDFVQKLVAGTEAVGGFKTLQQGASTTLVAALDPNLPNPTGSGENLFLDDCQLTPAVAWARDAESAEKLWKLSEALVGEEFLV